MLNRKTLISIIAVLCCTQAFGAASVRTVGTAQGTGGMTAARAGSLRTVSTQPSSSVAKTTTAVDSGRGASVGRIATSTPGSNTGVKPKVLKTGSGVSSAVLEELENRIEEYYTALDNKYNRLSMDVSDASTLAVTAKQMGDTNNTQLALKMNTGDFNAKFDELAATRELATKPDVQAYVTEYAPTPDLSEYYTKGQVDIELAKKVNTGEGFKNAFQAELASTSLPADVSDLSVRVMNNENEIVNLKENPGVDTAAINTMIDNKISPLATKAEVNNNNAILAGYVDANSSAIQSLTTSLGDKASKTQLDAVASQVTANAQTLGTKADVSAVNALTTTFNEALAGKVDASAMTNYYSKDETDNKITDKITEAQLNAGNVDLSNYYDKETVDEKITGVTTSLNTAVEDINEALDGKVDASAMTDYYSKDETDNKITDKITEAQLNAGNVDLSNYYDKETVDEKITGVTTSLNTAVAGINEALDGKADTTAIETLAGQVASNATALGDVYDKETANSLFATTDYVDGKVQEAQGLDPEEIQGIVENYLGNTSIVTPETLAEHVTMAEETYANKETTNSALEQLNTTLANKADTANLNEVAASLGTLAETVGTLSENVANALDGKADANNVYTISVADATFVAKNDDLMTQIGTNKDAITEIEEELAGKLDNDAAILNQITTNATNIESLQNKDTELAAAIAEIPTESEVNNKINTAIAGIGLSNYLNKDEASTTYTTNEQFNTLTNTVTNDIASLQTNKLDTATAASTYLTQANASSTYATTDYVDGKVQEAQGLDPEEIQGIVENYLGNTSIVTPETLAEHVEMAEATYATNSALGTLAGTVENVANALDGKLDNDAAILNKITANETNIATLQTDMANKLDTATAASTYLTQANASSTYATAATLQNVNDKVVANTNTIEDINNDISGLKSRVDTAEGNITNLTAEVSNKATPADVAAALAEAKAYAEGYTNEKMASGGLCGDGEAEVTSTRNNDNTITYTVNCRGN